jgi:ribosomal protein S18 acetylase RimI-like enzyme
MKRSDGVHIRPMTAKDVTRLSEIDPNFESPTYLDVVKELDGLNATWRLVQRTFDTPFVCTDYDFDEHECQRIKRRLKSGDGLWLVAETVGLEGAAGGAGRLIGMVDVKRDGWREAGFVWNIAVDRTHRRHGLGRELMERVVEWGRREGLRAIILETQTNNWPACHFYHRFGFELSGIDDHFYTNHDVANKEVALFWTYEL